MSIDFSARRLLITGGTGSFGTAVLNRFLHTDTFSEIRIFSRDEKKQDDMRHALQDSKVRFYIGDVAARNVSGKVVENVLNYTDYVKRVVWREY